MATPTEQDRERATALVVSCVKITTLKEADRRRVTMDGEKPWRIAQVAAEQIEPAIAQALADERERFAEELAKKLDEKEAIWTRALDELRADKAAHFFLAVAMATQKTFRDAAILARAFKS